jgi:phosphoribosylformylglycinamidine (FGAM) synthase-like enzyme
MIAGGIGTISSEQTKKIKFDAGTLLIQLGGPGMRIGMARRGGFVDGGGHQLGGPGL